MQNKIRLIDANALTSRMCYKKSSVADRRFTEGFNDAIARFRSMIHSAPVIDAVPVVRCGKCRYARNAGFRTITGNEAYWCVNNTRIGCTQVLDSDDFCSYGEEKEVVE